MTSELKPLDLNKLKSARDAIKTANLTTEQYNAFEELFNAMSDALEHCIRTHTHTRAAPDVPGLVRYDHQLVGTREDISGMLEDANGEYVRYDQAAAVIEELKRLNREVSLENTGVYNSYYDERRKVVSLEAELAQIKAQMAIDHTDEIEQLREALKQTRVDLVILSGNVSDAAKTCSKWDGMYERVRSWIGVIDAALSGKSPS